MYTVYMPKGTGGSSTVLTIRVTPELNRRLARAARTSRRTRSETARAILETALSGGPVEDPAAEARRQSLLASSRESERDVLDFITTAADLRGWE
jgi:predicted transcriptional regulator